MTLVEHSQDKSSTSLKIKELLIRLCSEFRLTQTEIGEHVGVSQTFLSGVSNDKRKGGKQLLAGLLLLIELETLKQEKAEVEKMREALRLLTAPSAPFLMNDTAPNANQDTNFPKSATSTPGAGANAGVVAPQLDRDLRLYVGQKRKVRKK